MVVFVWERREERGVFTSYYPCAWFIDKVRVGVVSTCMFARILLFCLL